VFLPRPIAQEDRQLASEQMRVNDEKREVGAKERPPPLARPARPWLACLALPLQKLRNKYKDRSGKEKSMSSNDRRRMDKYEQEERQALHRQATKKEKNGKRKSVRGCDPARDTARLILPSPGR
jgi:hypothetical protein